MGTHSSSEGLATGHRHDQSIWVLSLPLGIAVGLVLGIKAALIASASCWAGGLWLSPDLDTRSNALRRWGALGFLWWPYRLLVPHRSLWSHGPLLGTTARLAVLLTWCLIVTMAVPALSPVMLLTKVMWRAFAKKHIEPQHRRRRRQCPRNVHWQTYRLCVFLMTDLF